MIEVSSWIKANWLLLMFLALVASAFILLRSKPSNVASFDELNGVLAAGQPTVVEFYSNL
ncbi:MAG: hypothetical protein JSV81_19855 [Anaerolineales bacterium]|nr:MAG: hypothetical protein JSV81_19855 [Anaerolineales bacterium]